MVTPAVEYEPQHRKSKVKPRVKREIKRARTVRRTRDPKWWTIPRCWEGQDAFVIAGGTSVTDEQLEIARTRGNVIAVNSAYQFAPFADYLFFADLRWWSMEFHSDHGKLHDFKGRVVSTSAKAKGRDILRLRRISPPPGIAPEQNTVILRRTSLHPAIEMAYKMGAARIFLIGADNRDGENGRTHRHEEYPWVRKPQTWNVKLDDLNHLASALADTSCRVFNCSPISTLKYWPKVDLKEVLG